MNEELYLFLFHFYPTGQQSLPCSVPRLTANLGEKRTEPKRREKQRWEGDIEGVRQRERKALPPPALSLLNRITAIHQG